MDDKEKDLDRELTDMLRGVPPQNILISFDGKPVKPLADYAKEPVQQKKRKPREDRER